MRLAITIDTEADDQWQHGTPISTRNVGYWEPFQEICEKHGAAPTYLITSEIVEDESARRLLTEWSRRGAAEIGAHLHVWTTPPFAEQPGLRYNDSTHAFAAQLPDELLGEKTRVLTEQIAVAFGERPTSYRAGRFGFDRRGGRFLAEAGYKVDSSVTPGWSWKHHAGLNGAGGPDFSAHTPQPFLIQNPEAPDLVEIPVTLLSTYALLRRWPALMTLYRSLPVRTVRRLLLSRWLRPQPMWLSPDPRYRVSDLESVWRCAVKADLVTTVMMFHSSELMPGGSPFRPDRESVRELLATVDAFLGFVRRSSGELQTLTAMADALTAEKRLPVRAL